MTGNLKVHRLNYNEKGLESFKCVDTDLNDFLINEAVDYQRELLAVTYLVEDTEGAPIAYFSLLNDAIRLNDEEKNKWNKLNRKIPNGKRRSHYPAIKLGRLAVSLEHSHEGLGSSIIGFIIYTFSNDYKSGCRFLTVDAYKSATGFYEKCGFKYFSDNDIDDETRIMYMDLKKH